MAFDLRGKGIGAIEQRRGLDAIGRELNRRGTFLDGGDTVPVDGESGYKTGCLFIHTDGTPPDDVWYVNVGTVDSCNFDAVDLATL